MPKISAGLLMYRKEGQDKEALEVFLAHPGGPYYVNRDMGHWTIPKGLIEPEEELLAAAIREFEEETGIKPQGPYFSLPMVRYSSSRKYLHAWAFAGKWEEDEGIVSNTFEVEWPPRSGTLQVFPEIDRAAWFSIPEALQKVHPVQVELITSLVAMHEGPELLK